MCRASGRAEQVRRQVNAVGLEMLAEFRRIPVASNRPITPPSSLRPVCRKRKISCMDDFAFHAGQLGEADELSAAVGQSATDGRSH